MRVFVCLLCGYVLLICWYTLDTNPHHHASRMRQSPVPLLMLCSARVLCVFEFKIELAEDVSACVLCVCLDLCVDSVLQR